MPAIIGTAGHIDHGKTALVKALTGVDTDRLKEERERGISIDLGFARFAEGEVEAGVVDVPGHERFIRNMLAGAHGVDLALLVVAADDGVMPQTEEHADILHLLGVRRAVVAITKVDLVDAERRAAVAAEVELLLDGTGLAGAPIVAVSTFTGEGLPELRAALAAELRVPGRREPGGCFRLPIDRAFIMRGHGVVVTGTAVAGRVRPGATLRILPGGATARVRGVQVHGRAVEEAQAGQRVALNLGGVEHGDVRRGQLICDPALDRVTERFDAWVELRPAARRPLASHAEVRVYLGTAEALGKVVWLDGREALSPKDTAYAQLVLRSPLAVCGGDRFVLRAGNASATIGGGVVLNPFAPAAGRGGEARTPLLAAVRSAAAPGARLAALLALDPAFAVGCGTLAAAADLSVEAVRAHLAQRPDVRPLPDAGRPEAYASAEKWERVRAVVREALGACHRREPRQPGMEMESLRAQVGRDLAPKVFRAVVEQLAADGVLARDGSTVHLPGHAGGLDRAEAQIAERAVAELAAGGFTPPDTKALAATLGVAPGRLDGILAELERASRVVRAAPDLCFHAEAVERARQLLRVHAERHGDVTAAAFRDLIGASRKFALALLNYFDRSGFTLRVGDVRKLRRGPSAQG